MKAWWCCSVCRKPLVPKGKQFQEAMIEHRKVCSPTAGGQLKVPLAILPNKRVACCCTPTTCICKKPT
jgi:hypothetical protein